MLDCSHLSTGMLGALGITIDWPKRPMLSEKGAIWPLPSPSLEAYCAAIFSALSTESLPSSVRYFVLRELSIA
jgi:hypothetical protein